MSQDMQGQDTHASAVNSHNRCLAGLPPTVTAGCAKRVHVQVVPLVGHRPPQEIK